METSRLPVYNAARELYIQIHRSTQKVPADLRRGRITSIKESVLEVMGKISNANEVKDLRERLAFIDGARKLLYGIEVEMRCIYDLGFLRKRSFAAIIRCEENVSRQLAGWEKKTLSNAQ